MADERETASSSIKLMRNTVRKSLKGKKRLKPTNELHQTKSAYTQFQHPTEERSVKSIDTDKTTSKMGSVKKVTSVEEMKKASEINPSTPIKRSHSAQPNHPHPFFRSRDNSAPARGVTQNESQEEPPKGEATTTGRAPKKKPSFLESNQKYLVALLNKHNMKEDSFLSNFGNDDKPKNNMQEPLKKNKSIQDINKTTANSILPGTKQKDYDTLPHNIIPKKTVNTKMLNCSDPNSLPINSMHSMTPSNEEKMVDSFLSNFGNDEKPKNKTFQDTKKTTARSFLPEIPLQKDYDTLPKNDIPKKTITTKMIHCSDPSSLPNNSMPPSKESTVVAEPPRDKTKYCSDPDSLPNNSMPLKKSLSGNLSVLRDNTLPSNDVPRKAVTEPTVKTEPLTNRAEHKELDVLPTNCTSEKGSVTDKNIKENPKVDIMKPVLKERGTSDQNNDKMAKSTEKVNSSCHSDPQSLPTNHMPVQPSLISKVSRHGIDSMKMSNHENDKVTKSTEKVDRTCSSDPESLPTNHIGLPVQHMSKIARPEIDVPKHLNCEEHPKNKMPKTSASKIPLSRAKQVQNNNIRKKSVTPPGNIKQTKETNDTKRKVDTKLSYSNVQLRNQVPAHVKAELIKRKQELVVKVNEDMMKKKPRAVSRDSPIQTQRLPRNVTVKDEQGRDASERITAPRKFDQKQVRNKFSPLVDRAKNARTPPTPAAGKRQEMLKLDHKPSQEQTNAIKKPPARARQSAVLSVNEEQFAKGGEEETIEQIAIKNAVEELQLEELENTLKREQEIARRERELARREEELVKKAAELRITAQLVNLRSNIVTQKPEIETKAAKQTDLNERSNVITKAEEPSKTKERSNAVTQQQAKETKAAKPTDLNERSNVIKKAEGPSKTKERSNAFTKQQAIETKAAKPTDLNQRSNIIKKAEEPSKTKERSNAVTQQQAKETKAAKPTDLNERSNVIKKAEEPSKTKERSNAVTQQQAKETKAAKPTDLNERSNVIKKAEEPSKTKERSNAVTQQQAKETKAAKPTDLNERSNVIKKAEEPSKTKERSSAVTQQQAIETKAAKPTDLNEQSNVIKKAEEPSKTKERFNAVTQQQAIETKAAKPTNLNEQSNAITKAKEPKEPSKTKEQSNAVTQEQAIETKPAEQPQHIKHSIAPSSEDIPKQIKEIAPSKITQESINYESPKSFKKLTEQEPKQIKQMKPKSPRSTLNPQLALRLRRETMATMQVKSTKVERKVVGVRRTIMESYSKDVKAKNFERLRFRTHRLNSSNRKPKHESHPNLRKGLLIKEGVQATVKPSNNVVSKQVGKKELAVDEQLNKPPLETSSTTPKTSVQGSPLVATKPVPTNASIQLEENKSGSRQTKREESPKPNENVTKSTTKEALSLKSTKELQKQHEHEKLVEPDLLDSQKQIHGQQKKSAKETTTSVHKLPEQEPTIEQMNNNMPNQMDSKQKESVMERKLEVQEQTKQINHEMPKQLDSTKNTTVTETASLTSANKLLEPEQTKSINHDVPKQLDADQKISLKETASLASTNKLREQQDPTIKPINNNMTRQVVGQQHKKGTYTQTNKEKRGPDAAKQHAVPREAIRYRGSREKLVKDTPSKTGTLTVERKTSKTTQKLVKSPRNRPSSMGDVVVEKKLDPAKKALESGVKLTIRTKASPEEQAQSIVDEYNRCSERIARRQSPAAIKLAKHSSEQALPKVEQQHTSPSTAVTPANPEPADTTRLDDYARYQQRLQRFIPDAVAGGKCLKERDPRLHRLSRPPPRRIHTVTERRLQQSKTVLNIQKDAAGEKPIPAKTKGTGAAQVCSIAKPDKSRPYVYHQVKMTREAMRRQDAEAAEKTLGSGKRALTPKPEAAKKGRNGSPFHQQSMHDWSNSDRTNGPDADGTGRNDKPTKNANALAAATEDAKQTKGDGPTELGEAAKNAQEETGKGVAAKAHAKKPFRLEDEDEWEELNPTVPEHLFIRPLLDQSWADRISSPTVKTVDVPGGQTHPRPLGPTVVGSGFVPLANRTTHIADKPGQAEVVLPSAEKTKSFLAHVKASEAADRAQLTAQVKASEAADRAQPTAQVKASEAADRAKPTAQVKASEAADRAKPTAQVKASEAANRAQPTAQVKASEAADRAQPTAQVKASEAADRAQPTAQVKASEAADRAQPTAQVKASEAADRAQPTAQVKASEAADRAQPTAQVKTSEAPDRTQLATPVYSTVPAKTSEAAGGSKATANVKTSEAAGGAQTTAQVKTSETAGGAQTTAQVKTSEAAGGSQTTAQVKTSDAAGGSPTTVQVKTPAPDKTAANPRAAAKQPKPFRVEMDDDDEFDPRDEEMRDVDTELRIRPPADARWLEKVALDQLSERTVNFPEGQNHPRKIGVKGPPHPEMRPLRDGAWLRRNELDDIVVKTVSPRSTPPRGRSASRVAVAEGASGLRERGWSPETLKKASTDASRGLRPDNTVRREGEEVTENIEDLILAKLNREGEARSTETKRTASPPRNKLQIVQCEDEPGPGTITQTEADREAKGGSFKSQINRKELQRLIQAEFDRIGRKEKTHKPGTKPRIELYHTPADIPELPDVESLGPPRNEIVRRPRVRSSGSPPARRAEVTAPTPPPVWRPREDVVTEAAPRVELPQQLIDKIPVQGKAESGVADERSTNVAELRMPTPKRVGTVTNIASVLHETMDEVAAEIMRTAQQVPQKRSLQREIRSYVRDLYDSDLFQDATSRLTSRQPYVRQPAPGARSYRQPEPAPKPRYNQIKYPTRMRTYSTREHVVTATTQSDARPSTSSGEKATAAAKGPPDEAPPPSAGGGGANKPPPPPPGNPNKPPAPPATPETYFPSCDPAVRAKAAAAEGGEVKPPEGGKPAEAPPLRHSGEPPLTGLSKHFNSSTLHGRANVAKATFALIGLYTVYRMLRKDPREY